MSFYYCYLSFLRVTACNASRILAIVWVLSIHLSVTLWFCVKTTQVEITKPLLWAATKTLVYCDKILCPWVRGFPSNKGIKEGYPLKRCYFAAIGLPTVKTVADRYRHAAQVEQYYSYSLE